MKLKFYKIISCVICLSLTLSLPIVAASLNMDETVTKVNERISTNLYNSLMTSYNYDSYMRGGNNINTYPDYYAGAYLDDNKKLNIVVVGNLTSAVEDITSRISANDTDIIYASGEVSYNELLATKELILNIFTQNYELYKNNFADANCDMQTFLLNFVGVGISQQNNTVVLHLKDISDDAIERISTIIPKKDYIVFEQRDSTSEDSTYKPGSGIHVDRDGGSGSMGFRCSLTYDNQTYNGFVTAGHVTGGLEHTSVYSSTNFNSSTRFGSLMFYSYDNVSTNNVDVAFVALLNDNDRISSTTKNNATLVDNYFVSIAEGTTVYMTGAGSNVTQSGEIDDNSYSFFQDESDVTLTDVLRCDYEGVGGDSGGIVYAEINGDKAVVGIHHGTVWGLFFGTDSIVIKASNIYDEIPGSSFYDD